MSGLEPLKIQLTSSYPRSPDDSASIFLRYLARALAQRGLRIQVLTPADQATGTTEDEGIQVIRFAYLPRRFRRLAYGSGMLPNLRSNRLLWLAVPFYLAGMSWKLILLTLRLRPDIVHAHWILPQGLVAAFAGRLIGVPTLISAHGGDAFAFRRGLGALLKHIALRLSTAWTANTQATARAAAAGAALRTAHVVPMGVSVAQFSAGCGTALRAEYQDGSVVLFVGRLVSKKGVDVLLNAFAQINSHSRARIQLWIVGEGDCRGALERLAAERGLSNQITFWGRIANQKLPDFYAAADVFVAPSVVTESGDTEGQGVVFLEAFSARVPVIATDVGGIGEIVRHDDTGWLVPPRNPELLARAIEQMLDDRGLARRLTENAFHLVKEHFDWPIIAGRFETLYRELAHNRV